LKERGVSADDLSAISAQLSIQKLLTGEVVRRLRLPTRMCRIFIMRTKRSLIVRSRSIASHKIVVTPRKEPQVRNRKNEDATNEAEAQRKVKMLMDRLNSGADFAQLHGLFRGHEYGDNRRGLGVCAGVGAESVRPSLKKMVVGMKPGQVSPVLQVKDGFRILKLVTRESPGQRGSPIRRCSRRFATRCAIARSNYCAQRIWRLRATKRG